MGSLLRIGLVYDLLGSAPDGPPDADAEYEPIETVEALEGAIRLAGHEPVRIGSPRELLAALGRGTLPKLDLRLEHRGGLRARGTARRGRPCCSKWRGFRHLARMPSRSPRASTRPGRSTVVAAAGVPDGGPRLCGLRGGARRPRAARAVPAVREAALGGHREGHHAGLARRGRARARARGGAHRHATTGSRR